MITGGCLCGRVRYEVAGDALFGLLCHCRDCQRSSGSGKQAIRNFCPNCGSLLFGTPEVALDIVTVYAGTLDDPNAFRPKYAQFTRDRPDWDKPDARLPEHETRG